MTTEIISRSSMVDHEIAITDWILARLRSLLMRFPERAGDLRPRIDSALDERWRLMRLRDAGSPFREP